MFSILLVYLLILLLLAGFSRWLDSRQTEKAFRKEELCRRRIVDHASMPPQDVINLLRR